MNHVFESPHGHYRSPADWQSLKQLKQRPDRGNFLQIESLRSVTSSNHFSSRAKFRRLQTFNHRTDIQVAKERRKVEFHPLAALLTSLSSLIRPDPTFREFSLSIAHRPKSRSLHTRSRCRFEIRTHFRNRARSSEIVHFFEIRRFRCVCQESAGALTESASILIVLSATVERGSSASGLPTAPLPSHFLANMAACFQRYGDGKATQLLVQ